jgi:hypothetical protein
VGTGGGGLSGVTVPLALISVADFFVVRFALNTGEPHTLLGDLQ